MSALLVSKTWALAFNEALVLQEIEEHFMEIWIMQKWLFPSGALQG